MNKAIEMLAGELNTLSDEEWSRLDELRRDHQQQIAAHEEASEVMARDAEAPHKLSWKDKR